jgi:HEAT repeat protein
MHVSCGCGFIFTCDLHRSVNATRDPALGARLAAGTLAQARCPSCAAAVNVEIPVVYHDETRRLMVLVLPPALRHRELEERAELLLQLARDRGFAVPAYVRDFKVVFGAAGLAELAALSAEAGEGRLAELERIAAELTKREAELTARAGPTVATGEVAPEEDPALDAVTPPPHAPIVDRALYGELPDGAPVVHTVVEESTNRVALGLAERPTGRDAALARFHATHSQALSAVDRGEVRILVRGRAAVASDAGPRVRVGLYRLPSYPLIVIGVGPGDPDDDGGEPTPLFFDVARADDQQALGLLAASFHVIIEAFDDAGEPLGRREVIAPLAANVRAAVTLAEEHLAQIPSARRSFDVAMSAFRAPGFDRWGRRDPRLDEDSFGVLPTPAAAQKALGVVAGWSEPSNEDYLLLVRSFPVEWWRRLRSRVIHRGVELGLVLPGLLMENAVAEGEYRSRKEIVGRTLAGFADLVAGRSAPNDLEPEQIAANWRALFILCEEEGVIVDARVAEMARQSAAGPVRPPLVVVQPRKEEASPVVQAQGGAAAVSARTVVRPAARSARDETGRIVMPLHDAAQTLPNPSTGDEEAPAAAAERDLRGESVKELFELLDDKDLRLAAALELARRTDPLSVGPIFAALRRMTRGEAVRVIPAVVKFGERAVPHLCDLLRSRKAYLRQGSALALGILKSGDGIDPLCELLVNEPTEIWKEVARALGEIGGGAVMSLAARLNDPDLAEGDAQERITWALAHVVAKGARAQVETLAGGRDLAAAGAARRALELAGAARDNDAEVRGPLPPHDQTVNRAFSRRFFETLGVAPGRAPSEEIELSSASVSIDEDVDILDADEAVIEEEDILPS